MIGEDDGEGKLCLINHRRGIRRRSGIGKRDN